MIFLLAFFVVFIVAAVLRVPVAFSILLGGLTSYALIGLNTAGVPSAMVSALDSFPLLAIPAFIFAGALMAQGGISEALIRFIKALMGNIRGALGAVLVLTAAVFGAITGSSVATVSAIGGIMVPEMEKDGYDRRYICAILAASGILGTLIPPSVPGIQYALVAGLKITDVWISTLAPGLLLTVLYCIANYIVYGRKQPKHTRFSGNALQKPNGEVMEVIEKPLSEFKSHEILAATPKAIVAFIMPVIIFGGVYGGVFTATEAGAVSVAYGLLAGWVLFPVFFKQKPELGIMETARDAAISSLTIALLICTANVIGRAITLGGISAKMTALLMSISTSPVAFLISVNILLLIVGMFLETNTGILLFSPILVPIAQAYGVDPLHFGAILLLNLEIGLITPPFAANLFVACKITRTSLDEVIKPMIPFYICCLAVLILTTFCPQFSLFIPNALNS